jgi:hypothetical protein
MAGRQNANWFIDHEVLQALGLYELTIDLDLLFVGVHFGAEHRDRLAVDVDAAIED